MPRQSLAVSRCDPDPDTDLSERSLVRPGRLRNHHLGFDAVLPILGPFGEHIPLQRRRIRLPLFLPSNERSLRTSAQPLGHAHDTQSVDNALLGCRNWARIRSRVGLLPPALPESRGAGPCMAGNHLGSWPARTGGDRKPRR